MRRILPLVIRIPQSLIFSVVRIFYSYLRGTIFYFLALRILVVKVLDLKRKLYLLNLLLIEKLESFGRTPSRIMSYPLLWLRPRIVVWVTTFGSVALLCRLVLSLH
jgi:hypothetical protein